MTWLKENFGGVLGIAVLLSLFAYHKDWFFIEVLLFMLIMKVFNDVELPKNLRIYLLLAIWGTVILYFGLTSLGNFVLNYKHPPDWLETFRSSESIVTAMALVIAGILIGNKAK